jgi:hypothetical protein
MLNTRTFGPRPQSPTQPITAMLFACILASALAACGDSPTGTASASKGESAPQGSTHNHDHDRDADPSPEPAENPPAPDKPAAAAGRPALPTGLMLSRRPLGALGVASARAGIRPGEPVSVIGRIGGSRSPIVSNRAVFTIVDPDMKCCLETGDSDHCPRPWDYCCSDRTRLAAATATIEICGPDGKPLALSLEQEGTLKPLTLIAVNGVLESPDASGTFVIRARGIYLMPGDPLAERIKALK